MKKYIRVFFCVFASAFVLCITCCKESNIQTETIIIQDTVRVTDTVWLNTLISDTVTTFILVRHAEKDTIGSDPNLSQAGLLRAEILKNMLQPVAINHIYSTPYNRTKQTAMPLANALGKTITEYSTALSYPNLVTQLKNENKNKVALVVGHSNTIPELLKELSNNTFVTQIHDTVYDDLYLVTLPNQQAARIISLKYGQ